ncbi:MAG TPA: cobaltochelatase subunit CobN, partial [Pyrinomonadaceae bacterium]|nr:cobaltochelatase subunit CobN [Pyrinomonadaceae bacterium]
MSLNITVLYVGSSLLAPLKNAERAINRDYDLDLRVAAYNFGSPLDDREWQDVDRDLSQANIVFVIHVMDGENASRLVSALERYQHGAVVVINCMPDLMRLTRMGKLDVGKFAGWMGRYAKSEKRDRKHRHHHYLKLIDRLPGILKFLPTAGALTDAKHYLYLFCYFLQPTPANIQSMLLYSLKHYARDPRLKAVKTPAPQQVNSVAIYHPDGQELFETFEAYAAWHKRKRKRPLDPDKTIGLLLMRPQVVSKTTKHYDALIHAIEDEGLNVIPAIATLMDNREAVSKFFHNGSKRISQIVSLTGFSFVGGPAMNDSAAASEFLRALNLPYRSAVSLDTQTIEAWRESQTGLNPVQAGMQIAIPEIDGATEPFIYGGIPVKGHEPMPLENRCRRFARRLKRWNNLQTSP